MVPSVTFLGHIIDSKGLHLVRKKFKAVEETLSPNRVSELKWYLGLLSSITGYLEFVNCVTPIVLFASARHGIGERYIRRLLLSQRNCCSPLIC